MLLWCMAGGIYAYSSRIYRLNGHALPYAWNHSIGYDGDQLGQMPYLVERLSTRHIHVNFDDNTQLLSYQLTAYIEKGDSSNQCPDGFQLHPKGTYCTGMYTPATFTALVLLLCRWLVCGHDDDDDDDNDTDNDT